MSASTSSARASAGERDVIADQGCVTALSHPREVLHACAVERFGTTKRQRHRVRQGRCAALADQRQGFRYFGVSIIGTQWPARRKTLRSADILLLTSRWSNTACW